MCSVLSERYWKKALDLSESAKSSGALVPLKTSVNKDFHQQYSDFELRHLDSIFPKDHSKQTNNKNPFDPWDKRLEIDLIGHNHVLILNKYPVQKGHMLLISKGWKSQISWLNSDDFRSLVYVNNDTTGLWFYNSGPKAGASQNHRHIQLLRRDNHEILCPRYKWFQGRINNSNNSHTLLEKSSLVKPLRENEGTRKELQLYQHYLEIAYELGLGNPKTSRIPASPYNLIISNNWIAMIKRSNDSVNGFSINSLGFAGYLLSTQNSDYKWLTENGPTKLLEGVVSD